MAELKIGGTWAHTIGDTGSVGALQWVTRYPEQGASGMYEASWTMPLPPDFEHPLLRRGQTVEIMDGPWRIGSPLVLTEPVRGRGWDEPWKLSASGIGREVEGDHSFYCFDGSGNATTIPATAVDQAIARGWDIAGRDASVPSTAYGASASSDPLNTVAALLNSSAGELGKRWGVGQDNILRYLTPPTTPTWFCAPGTAHLGVADDEWASVVFVRFVNSSTGNYATAFAPAAGLPAEARYGRREWAFDATDLGPISATRATNMATAILAKSKGRLGWTNRLTLRADQLLSEGGVPADLATVEGGQMVRLQGVWSDLLETTGQTGVDIIIAETTYADGAPTIDIAPVGLVTRDMATVFEKALRLPDVA